jgi:hypothetical protein
MSNQTLDDFDQVQPKKSIPQIANWKYRTVGVFRLLISAIVFFTIVLYWHELLQERENINLIEFRDFKFIIGKLLITGLLTFPLTYYIQQGWAELLTKEDILKKRPFRGIAMFFTVILIVIISIITIVIFRTLDSSLETAAEIGGLIGIILALLVLISVFWMDRQYQKHE